MITRRPRPTVSISIKDDWPAVHIHPKHKAFRRRWYA
jgi:hypothetical protein